MSPTVGLTVRYTVLGPDPRPAIITKLYPIPGVVSLVVFSETGFEFKREVPFSEESKPGHWSWITWGGDGKSV